MFQFEHKLLNVSISVHSVWSTLFWHTHTEYSLSMEYVLSDLHAIQYNTIQDTHIQDTHCKCEYHNAYMITVMYDTHISLQRIFLNQNFKSCY